MQQNKADKPGRFFLTGLVLIVSTILADQYSKWLVLETMLRKVGDKPDFAKWFTTPQPLQFFIDQQESYNTVVLAPFLNLIMVWNQGVSFGMFSSDNPNTALLLIGLSLTISIFMIIWLSIASSRLIGFALSLVVGGAVGNVLDRLRFGAVADFIDVHFQGHHWPAFNLADSCIVIGVFLLVLSTATGKKGTPWG